MWVVKLGGSLHGHALLPQWLALLAELGGGRVAIVSGGGAFADEVRRAQALWHFADLPAHNMAVLAMAQGAHLLQALNPKLAVANSLAEIQAVHQRGQAAVWAPLDMLRKQADADTNWDVTSDSMALGLARRLHARRLLVVKACAVDAQATLPDLSAAGVLDGAFARLAQDVGFDIDILPVGQLEQARRLLLGDLARSNHSQPES